MLASLSRAFCFLFGKISWNTPPWINYLRQTAKEKPKAFWGGFVLILFLLMIALGSYYWYQSLPKPIRISAQIKPPKITPNEAELIPDEVSIDFGITTPHEFIPRAVAPLQSLGKPVTTGVTMTPYMPGEWTWASDNRLIFTPQKDWPAGQTYRIRFDKPFFAKSAQMESMQYEFSTLPFEAVIADFKFYQDPVRPEIRQAVAQINFSYPVDATSLENNITLMWQVLDKGSYYLKSQRFKYTIDYDQNKRIAYLHSENLPLPQVSRFLDLIIEKGVKPVSGSSTLDESLKANVLIPDKASFFKVKDLSTAIVRNPEDRPEQVLNLETTLGLTQDELNKFLHVYVLPKDYPKTAAFLAKPNYQWQEPGEVTQAILALATPLTLHAIPTDNDYASLHSFKYEAPESRYLYIKLSKGLRGFGNYDLANDYAAILKVPAYPQEISFLHKGALLALGTEEKLSVVVRGLPAVKFDFARILPDDLNHLITQTYGDFSNPQFINTTFNQNNVSQIASNIQTFDARDPSKSQYTALDLKKYLLTQPNGKHPLGLFLLRASGFDPEKKYELGIQSKRLILITDLGLLVKDNGDGTHDVFVESITQGTPVNLAHVSILGKNGIAIFTEPTDANGHVHFPALNDFINEREPVVYLVEQGSDVSFIPYNRVDRELNYSRFDVGGITHHQDESALTAYVFSDRGIYRPGDIIHIGMIVKEPYVVPSPIGVPLEATLIDPRGVTVKNEKITLNDTGLLTFDFQSNETSPTGQYSVNLYIVKDNHPSNLIGSTTINIADFLPDRMRISAHLSQASRGWISPKDLALNVSLVNLYGTPARDHRISAKMILSPQAVTFKEFPQYTFLDPLLNPQSPPKVFTETLVDTHTNDKGEGHFSLKLNRFEKATYQLSLFAEGFEQAGGRSVATRTTALVSPLAYLVGYKPDGDLTFIKQSTERKVKMIAINPTLQPQGLSGLLLYLYKLHPVTTLVKKPDGTYQYQSIMQTTKISNQPFAIEAAGSFYTLPTQTIGDFMVTFVDKTGTELSRFKYSVVGSSEQTLPKNAELDVKLNKTTFLPGDEIEMEVSAPYAGSGLITIERDKTYAFQWFKTTTTTSLQKIRIPNDFKGNGYINVAFIRDLNSPEIFTSPLSYSVVPFSVSHEDRAIKIDLNSPSLAEPGELFPILYKADKPCKMLIFAVDEGILQVASYEDPDPLKFFFEKQALEVKTLQIVDQILPKFIADRELSSVGGDGGEEAIKKYLNPFKRKTEAPVVYWSGILDADTTPRKLVYSIPDYFNGSLRVMAVAVAANAVGSATKNATIRGPFVISPNVPTFVTPGDKFDITATVANNIQGSLNETKIAINVETGAALEIIGKDQENMIIPEGQERSVHFRIRAKSLLGSTDITFKAQLNDKITKMSSTLSVRPASPYLTSITSGYATTNSKILTINRILFPEYKKVTAAVSQSPLVLATGMQHYLDNYPYGCTEQLVSKAFPLLAMINQPWFIHNAEQINASIQKTILMLSERQMSNGAFSYWPEVANLPSNEFISVYAMHFLTEAKTHGYVVSNEVFASGLSFLKEVAAQNINSLEEARKQAYAIYLLTRNEIVTTNYLTHLQSALDNHPNFDWRKDITSAYIVSAYQLLKSSHEANKIIRYFKPQIKANEDTTSENTDFYNPSIANAQYIYLLAKHFPEQISLIKLDLILSLVDALNNDSISTILSSYTTLAFALYGQSNISLNSLSIAETLQNGKQQPLFTPSKQYQIAFLNDAATAVTFINPSKQGYFYQLVETGFDQTPSKHAVNQGIEVYREFQNDEGKVINTASIGDELTVHLRARSLNNTYQDNIAIVDLLPGGFEVVRDSIPRKMDYVDVREDRVIFFGSLNPDTTDIVYRIKATNIGKFTIPPIYATSMYQPLIKSLGSVGNMTVSERE